MALVNSNYLPGDSVLVDQIVYELKSQGIFDHFRKECIADVDTKPAYQNLRQRVEGSVAGFLNKQKWSPDMNKNQVREMLRKNIYESGFLETGVERIVDQVVNPKINSIFQPKVAEVAYKFLGIEKPKQESNGQQALSVCVDNLLPTYLEAVSPESEPLEKKHDKSYESQNLDDSRIDDDESPPFEPIEEQTTYLPPEENSVDSHMSGFSGLASHDSSHSNDNMKQSEIDIFNQDSQISKHSSDGQVSMVISDENDTKLETGDDSRNSKSSKSHDSTTKGFEFNTDTSDKSSSSLKKDKSKSEDKLKAESKKSDSHKYDKHRSRHDSKSENRDEKKSDKRDSKDKSKDHGSRDSRDKKDSKNSSRSDRDKDRRSSGSKHSSSKKESSNKDDKSKSSSRDAKRDSKTDSKSSSKSCSEKNRKDDKPKTHSSSSKNDKEKGDGKRDAKKENKDDHFSSKGKKSDRRSTDRDSNDGHSGTGSSSTSLSETVVTQQQNKSQDSNGSNSGSGSNDSGASDNVVVANQELQVASAPSVVDTAITAQKINEFPSGIKLIRPKFASNIHEAKKLRRIRKHLQKLEKEGLLELATIEKEIIENNISVSDKICEVTDEIKVVVPDAINDDIPEFVSPPLQNSVSAASWDAVEAKLNSGIDYDSYGDYPETPDKNSPNAVSNDELCLYLPNEIPPVTQRYRIFIENYIDTYHEELSKSSNCADSRTTQKYNDYSSGKKRKLAYDHEHDLHNNNKRNNNHVTEAHHEKFHMPLSPAESDKSLDKKIFGTEIAEKQRKNKFYIKAKATQRYSSDDLYKPRLFNGSRRRSGRTTVLD